VTWRPSTREERQLAALWCFAALASLALRPLWLEIVPFLPACPFRVLTGVPCLSCGTTHAAVALLEGRVMDAFAANPLAALAGAAFVCGGVLAPLWVVSRLPVPVIPTPLPRWLRAGAFAALAASWAYLIVIA
jgi:hypothetical protein